MAYYIPEGTKIDHKTWTLVQHYSKHDEPLELLDAEQMYEIIDLAPDWSCVEPNYYKELCRGFDVDYDAYDDIEGLMEAIADKLGKELTPTDNVADYGEGFTGR